MNKNITGFFIFVLICIIFYLVATLVSWRSKARLINQEYKGIITNKLIQHGTVIKIETIKGKKLEVTRLSGEMIDKAQIGDSIYKIMDVNLCILNSKDTLKYLHTSD